MKNDLNIPGLAEAKAEVAALRKIGRIVADLPKAVAVNTLGRIMFALQSEIQAQRGTNSQAPSTATEADPA